MSVVPWAFKKPSQMTPDEYKEYLIFSMRWSNIRNRFLYFWYGMLEGR